MIKGDMCCAAYSLSATTVYLCGRWEASEVPSWVETYGGFNFICKDDQIREARTQLRLRDGRTNVRNHANSLVAGLFSIISLFYLNYWK